MLLWREERRFRKNITHGLASKFWILKERRRFVRFDKEIRINYNLRNKSSDKHFSRTSNISRKGLCLLAYEKLKEKSCLDLELDIPGFSRPVKTTGQVVWIKELKNQDTQGRRQFYIGIRFLKIRPEAEAALLIHLNTLESPEGR
jgi:hypothetical protein